ncbi:hypothetical protein [Sphingobacterium sp. DR205]|uniref:hypothetical protein n=1 Tax=Sphingobacterium sp. DR205 TaxID=2713573 RepID=UPI0013E45930|nr:hypothetical protein [Sphingobacterium sp. DR205]QIH35602.1 hypothetical protein G6053_23215 [Sphingobacterium sp. DR205]
MMQQQSNGKGQDSRYTSETRPISSMWIDPERGHPAGLAEVAHVIAGDQWILPGSCCCAGPVRDRHGRRFTTFPPGRYRENGLAE